MKHGKHFCSDNLRPVEAETAKRVIETFKVVPARHREALMRRLAEMIRSSLNELRGFNPVACLAAEVDRAGKTEQRNP